MKAIALHSIVPVRAEEREGSEQLTQLLFAETVEILEEKPRWIRIKNDADGLLLGIRKSGREPTKEEMDKVCKSIYEYYIHNSPDLLGSVAGYVRSASDTEIIRKVIGFSEQDLEGIGSYF